MVSYKHCTQEDVYGATRTCGVKIRPDFYAVKCPYLENERFWWAMLFREHFLSDVLQHLHNNNDNANKLFLTSSRTRPYL